MREDVFLGLLLVGFQGSLENGLEARGRRSCGWRLGHECRGTEAILWAGLSVCR
jgi:hypothetical protein